MGIWKRDLARGLVVVAPVLVTGFVLYLLYGFIEGLTPGFLVPNWLLEGSLRMKRCVNRQPNFFGLASRLVSF